MELSKSKLEACVQEIDTWMLLNKLKLNREKTELLLISSLHRARPPLLHLDVCDERGLTSPKAGNIGVIFDEYLSMVPQVTAMCKSAFYHLRKIALFVYILPSMQLSFWFTLSLHQSLTTVIPYYMVYPST